MQRLFYPSYSGDIRFEAGPEGRARLTVEKPTLDEIRILKAYLAHAVAKGWTTAERAEIRSDFAKDGSVDIPLDASLDDASRLFLGSRAPAKGVILGVRYADGSIAATLDGPAEGEDLLAPPPEPPDPRKAIEATKGRKGKDKSDAVDPVAVRAKPDETPAKKPEAAVVTPRPTLCCPYPVQGHQDRASEVLWNFTTPDQWDEWTRTGMIHVKGNLTGDTYRVVHRKHPLAQKQGKITWCETRDHVVHCHQTHLPPPEEVLAVILTLQFGEDYIRNASGYFGPGVRFPHPLGRGHWDGIASAGFVSSLGMALNPALNPALGMALTTSN